MKASKRLLSTLLSLALCAGLLAVPAMAVEVAKPGAYTRLSSSQHSAAIDANGALWMWGSNEYGQLGNGTTESATAPFKVMDNVVSVSCGDSYTAAIKADGTLWTWGSNFEGRLGNNGQGNASGVTDLNSSVYYIEIQTVPMKVLDNVTAVSCGSAHTAAITADGALWLWGVDEFDELGSLENPDVPEKIMDGVAAVSCAGDQHIAVLKTDGTLWSWGSGVSDVPIQILDNVTAVSCGYFRTAAIRADGSLWTCDYRDSYEDGSVPLAKVMDNVTAVSCNFGNTAAIKTDGTLWTWGYNDYGQLGNGSTEDSDVPVKVLDNVAAVSCGLDNTSAVKTDGTLWTWGGGALGYEYSTGEEFTPQLTPRQVPGIVMSASAAPAAVVPPTPKAYPSTQTVDVDGKAVDFQMYALKDEKGDPTNYIKLRDLALLLNGTDAQFDVGWDGAVSVTTGKAYTPNGTELKTPFSGERSYKEVTDPTKVNGVETKLAAFVLTDDAGGGYTYYKLRDLGQALGFNVDWAADRGVFIETDKPYSAN